MTILIAAVGAIALLFGLMAILLIRGSEDGRLPTDLAACMMAFACGSISWISVLVLFILSFVAQADILAKAVGGLALCLPFLPLLSLKLRMPLFWGLGWVLSAAFYVSLLLH